MKKGTKIIIAFVAVLLVAAIGFGGFVLYKSSQGLAYDISSVEKLENDVEIVSETEDSVTVKMKSNKDFKVLMFTDTHLKGDKELDNMTVSYMVSNGIFLFLLHKPLGKKLDRIKTKYGLFK